MITYKIILTAENAVDSDKRIRLAYHKFEESNWWEARMKFVTQLAHCKTTPIRKLKRAEDNSLVNPQDWVLFTDCFMEFDGIQHILSDTVVESQAEKLDILVWEYDLFKNHSQLPSKAPMSVYHPGKGHDVDILPGSNILFTRDPLKVKA